MNATAKVSKNRAISSLMFIIQNLLFYNAANSFVVNSHNMNTYIHNTAGFQYYMISMVTYLKGKRRC